MKKKARKKKVVKPLESTSDEANAYYENLLQIQVTDPKRFALLSPQLKRAVGYYTRARDRAMIEKLEKRGS